MGEGYHVIEAIRCLRVEIILRYSKKRRRLKLQNFLLLIDFEGFIISFFSDKGNLINLTLLFLLRHHAAP